MRSNPHVVAIIQARIGSSRLPGKTMKHILGKPMLWHLINRLKQSQLIEKIVIATTNNAKDETILEMAKELGIDSYAGSEDDVLDRYYQAAKKYNAEVVVRITADCPLIDLHIVDKVIQRFLEGDCDYATNALIRTYPDGLDVGAFSYTVLEKVWKEARWSSEREHVTSYIYKNPDKFRLASVQNDIDLSHLRWTVDEDSDLEFVKQVYEHLYREGHIFYMEDILELLKRYPHLEKINEGIATNEGYAKSVKEDRLVK